MYSQSRTNGNNLGESEDARFKREWRQPKTKMCDDEHIIVCKTEKYQNDVKASPKLQSFNFPYSSRSLDRRIEKGITNGYENVCHSGENGSTDSPGVENGLVSDNNHYLLCEFSSDIYENDGDDFLSDNKHQPRMEDITGGKSKKEYIDKNMYRVRLVVCKIVRNRKLVVLNWVVKCANGQFYLNLFFLFEIYQFGFCFFCFMYRNKF